MRNTRKSIYIPDQMNIRLAEKCAQERVSQSEIMRRALLAYLIWDDPTYHNILTHHPRKSGPGNNF